MSNFFRLLMVRNAPLHTLLVLGAFFVLRLSAQLPEMSTPTPEPGVEAADPKVQPAAKEDWDPIMANRGKREWPENPKIFMIPVRQQIMHPQYFLLRRGVQEAVEAEADAIILLMDTPGGSVQVMQEMVNPIIDLDIPTYTLVENGTYGAISAGAIIALSTDYIYMQPRARIGDAMPVIAGPNGYQSLGEAEREKVESYMDAMVRSVAQAKDRDEEMIRAMVRRSIEYTWEDGTVISPEGQILTVTNKEAARPRPDGTPMLSEGTVDDLDEMLELVGLADAERIELQETWADDLALLITRIAPLLMTGALLLFYLEINSPGIGWMGGLAVLLFLIVMFGHNVAGLAGMEDLLLIVLGMILILIEILVLPGFGIAGVAGIVLMLWGLLQAMIIRYPGNPGDLPGLVNFGNVETAVINMSVAVLASFLGGILLLKSLGEHGLLGKRLVLATTLDSTEAPHEEPESLGLVGETGLAVTPLTPSGTVSCQGREYDARSDGVYVDAGSEVTVLSMQGSRLVVAPSSSPESTS